MTTDLKALLAQREELERQIRDMQSSQRTEAIAKIRELMAENGLSLADLNAKSATPKASSVAGSKVAPKYRDPESGSTWTGRGLQPKWLKSAVEAGKKPEDFLIGSAAQ
ncbi:H-NS histone family protein [Aquincola sp. MAHUQ-54]|uniref:H-NS histone family protein n=1 Tax=Aquincola agrisoli TaxID=3119538 RepID=A0AAW9Q3U6_9BURK